MIPTGIILGKWFLFSRNFGFMSWVRLALTNVQYAVSCPQKAYESQRDRVSERWNSMTNTSWQLPALLADIFSFPALGIPRSSSNNPYAFIFLLCTSQALSLFSSEAPPRSSYSFTKFSKNSQSLYFFSSLHTRDSGFDTPTCCEFQINLSGWWGRGGGVWRESVRGEISTITNTPAESLRSNLDNGFCWIVAGLALASESCWKDWIDVVSAVRCSPITLQQFFNQLKNQGKARKYWPNCFASTHFVHRR